MNWLELQRGSTLSVVANVQDSDIVVNEFELQPRYYAHFWSNTLEKGVKPLIPRYDLNSTSSVTKRMSMAWNNPQKLILFL